MASLTLVLVLKIITESGFFSLPLCKGQNSEKKKILDEPASEIFAINYLRRPMETLDFKTTGS